jgi:hypothetical protein
LEAGSTGKSQFPDAVEGRVHESAYYTFQALRKLFEAGLMRRMSSRSENKALGIATGLVAKQQEKNNAHQALAILDQALGVFDYPGAHLQKASIYRSCTPGSQLHHRKLPRRQIVSGRQADEG